MYVDAFVDIAKAGKITGARKNIDRYRQTYAFAAGTKKLYDYLNDNPECMSAPVNYTNDIARVSSIDNFISINNAVDVDLYGQISVSLQESKADQRWPRSVRLRYGSLLIQRRKEFCMPVFHFH